MLQRLVVKNYALIDELDIRFDTGLSIITGETGAGKSILLGALSLILGQRADTKSLLDQKRKCIVEGSFFITNYDLKPFFVLYDLDYQDITLLRREISPEGKSRAFINDTPVNLSALKEIGNVLVDIHSQHETLLLSDSSFQMSVIDVMADHADSLLNYRRLYNEYVLTIKELQILKNEQARAVSEKDYLQFQFDELDAAKLDKVSQSNLELERDVLNNAEKIAENLARISNLLDDDQYSISPKLSEAIQSATSISSYHPRFQEIEQRLKSMLIELRDLVSEIEDAGSEIKSDPGQLEIISEKLDRIYHLQQKHRLESIEELLDLRNVISNKLLASDDLDSQITKLEVRLNELISDLDRIGLIIRKQREGVIPEISGSLEADLHELGMPNSKIKINLIHAPNNTFGPDGIDKVEFLFSANKGVIPREISKVASGGELSRLMLCLKGIIAKNNKLSTLIFDEIDTGVSGEVALKMGDRIKALAKDIQVISITHLPQIATRGDVHFFVYKDQSGENTLTRIKKLKEEERIVEIAKMLGGDNPSAVAIENAKELLRS